MIRDEVVRAIEAGADDALQIAAHAGLDLEMVRVQLADLYGAGDLDRWACGGVNRYRVRR